MDVGGLGGGAVALLHEITWNRHEESRGTDVEALSKGVASYARMGSVLEVNCDPVQGRQSGDHRTEQGLEETRGGEFGGMANDHQPGLACDQIKVGQARLRADGG